MFLSPSGKEIKVHNHQYAIFNTKGVYNDVGHLDMICSSVSWTNSLGFYHSFDDQPAHMSFYSNGNIKSMSWSTNGIPCRTTGPSHITYSEAGEVIDYEYNRNRTNITTEVEDYADGLNMPVYLIDESQLDIVVLSII